MSRYSRLLSLSSFNENDLKTLQSKKVLIIGAGGVMGSVVGIISSMACTHLINYLIGKAISDQLISYNDINNQITKIEL